MKTFLAILILCVAAAFAAETNKTVTYPGKYLRPFPGPQTYKETESGIIYYVESDGRHIAAIGQDGKVLWHRDPFADAKLEFYRTKTPHIVYVGKASQRAEEYWATKGKKVIGINFDSSQFGELDVKTGDFTFGGQD